MDFKAIKTILDSANPESIKELQIYGIISKDKDSILKFSKALHGFMEDRNELLLDTNEKLSLATAHIDNPKMMKRDWTIQNITAHYVKWQHTIKCCFSFNWLPK